MIGEDNMLDRLLGGSWAIARSVPALVRDHRHSAAAAVSGFAPDLGAPVLQKRRDIRHRLIVRPGNQVAQRIPQWPAIPGDLRIRDQPAEGFDPIRNPRIHPSQLDRGSLHDLRAPSAGDGHQLAGSQGIFTCRTLPVLLPAMPAGSGQAPSTSHWAPASSGGC